MATYNYSKPADMDNFPPPEGFYLATSNTGQNRVRIGSGTASSPDSSDAIPLVTLANAMLEQLKAGTNAYTFEEIKGVSDTGMIVAGVAAAGLALWYFTRKKGAA